VVKVARGKHDDDHATAEAVDAKAQAKGGVMGAVKPFGKPERAIILVIGHDPRLQHSQAEASVAFFLDYLDHPRASSRSEARKYDLAQVLVDYVRALAGRDVSLEELYVTNLCNEFLDHTPGSGTVLIPGDKARKGIEEITKAIAIGSFQVIVPMAVQPFYHLCRMGFLDEETELVRRFVAGARPQAAKAEQGIYVQSGKAPFLAVCGQRFHHRGVPVVPVVHVKQWPLKARMVRYTGPMQNAGHQVRAVLGNVQVPGA
jgi:hypothetical protein